MEMKKVLVGFALTMLFTGWGIISGAVAAERSKGQVAVENMVFDSLGTATFATDVYHVHCAGGTSHLFADVDDQGPGAGVLISVCVHDSGGNPALCTTAPDTATSPGIEVFGGAGNYYVTFHKSPSSTSEAYDSIIQCHNASHGNVATTTTRVQNQ